MERKLATALAAGLAGTLVACDGDDRDPDLGEANASSDFAIAGLWDSTYRHFGENDAGMVHIMPDGLHASYDYKSDDYEASLGERGEVRDCYLKSDPVQLVDHVRHDGATFEGVYATASSPGSFFVRATVIDDGAALDWRWPDPLGWPAQFVPPPGHQPEYVPDQVFPAVVGIDVMDLTLC